MARLHIFLIAALTLTAASTHALSLNPLDWFSSEKEYEGLLRFHVVDTAEEREAQELVDRAMIDLEKGSTWSAKRRFKKVIKKYSTSGAAGEARMGYATILIADGKYKKAFRTLQDIITENPEYQEFNKIISAQFDCASALMNGARGRILWVIPGFKQLNEAILQFEFIIHNAPYSDYAPLALMNIALVSEEQDDPEIAIDALDRLINYYPQSMLAPDAYYNMAKTYSNLVQGPEYDQGSTRQAISYYEDFKILFPQSNYLGEVEANLDAMQNLLATSRLNLGNFHYFYRSNNTAALIFYNEAITIAPDSEAADEARERIADVEAGVRPASGTSFIRKLLLIN